MQLTSQLMILMAVVVTCRAAAITNMFSSAIRARHMQQQQPPPLMRPVANPWDDGTETYGYLADRHPMEDVGYQQRQQALVYGVPHRYLSDYPVMSNPTDQQQLYNNALLMRGRSPYTKRSSLASYYDLLGNDVMVDDVADDYDTPISRQDVVNFENYVQRFFQPVDDDVTDDDWALMPEPSVDDESDDDEEAARQLHLLLNKQQQRRPALREIQKKSAAATTTASTTTEAPVTTATTTTTISTAAPRHHQGQKEEALLRPPSAQRHSSPSAATPKPTEEAIKEDNSVYHTIQRLMKMRDQLENSSEEEATSMEDVSRAKRFVAPSQDSLLSKQIHQLDKIRA